MKTRSHDRAPDKKGFSIALPKQLLAEIQHIATSETRSRNGQIEKFLDDCVKQYKAMKSAEKAKPFPLGSVESDESPERQQKAN